MLKNETGEKLSKATPNELRKINKLDYLKYLVKYTEARIFPINKKTKVPTFEDYVNNAFNSVEEVEKWFKLLPNGELNYNVGLALSSLNLFMIDKDHHDNDFKTSDKFLSKYVTGAQVENKEANIEETAHDGLHYFYDINSLSSKDRTQLKEKSQSIEQVEVIKNTATIYPSQDYDFYLGSFFRPATKAPAGIKKLVHYFINQSDSYKGHQEVDNSKLPQIKGKHWHAKEKEKDDLIKDGIQKTQRNTTMVEYIGRVISLYKDENYNQLLERVKEANRAHFFPPLDEKKELEPTFNNCYKKPHNYVTDYKLDQRDSVIESKKAIKNWFKFNQDEKSLPYQALADIMLENFHFVNFSSDEGSRIAVYVDDPKNVKYGLYTQNYEYIRKLINNIYTPYNYNAVNEVLHKLEWGTEKLVSLEDYTPTIRHLVAVNNGIYNIKTKELKPYTPKIIFLSKIATNMTTSKPNKPFINGWSPDEWLADLMKDYEGNLDPEKVKLIWQVIADCVNANNPHNVAIMLYSQLGSTGKGTFQSLITHLVGFQNVGSLKLKDFSGRFALSALMGKSVCIGDDNPSSYINDVSSFNSIVTGEPVPIERKGETPFYTQLNTTIIQSFNELPKVDNKNGFGRRIRIIPFEQHFTGSKDNWHIKRDYLARKDVREYILYRALTEFADFKEIANPKSSIELEEQYNKENDTIKSFIEDEFINWKIPAITTKAFFNSYRRYCEESGYKALSLSRTTTRAKMLLNHREDKINYETKPVKITGTLIDIIQDMNDQKEIPYQVLADMKSVFNPQKSKTARAFIRIELD